MNPMITTILSFFFVLAGAICIYTMLEIRGRPKLTLNPRALMKIHKISGYIFVLLYLVISVLMIIKLRGYRVELSPRANLHMLLAVVALPIIVIKILIARFYKKLTAQLLFLGVLLLVLGVSFNAITGGYYLLRTTVDIASVNKSLVEQKCSKCHTLERAYSTITTKDGWKAIVEEMRNYDKQWIADSDVPKMVDYLFKIRGTVEKTEIAKSLFERKCSKCHPLEVALSKSMTKEQWLEVVKRMQGKDRDWLTDEDIVKISDYLSSVRGKE